MRALRRLARVFEIAPNPVLSWFVEVAEPLQAFAAYCLPDVHLQQAHLAALYPVLSAVRDGDVNEAEVIDRLARSPHWGWTAIDPETTWLLSVPGGDRPLAMAQAGFPQIAQLLAPVCMPLFWSDGDPNYFSAMRISRSRTAWYSAQKRRWIGSGPPAAGRSTRPLANASICRCASLWPRWGGG